MRKYNTLVLVIREGVLTAGSSSARMRTMRDTAEGRGEFETICLPPKSRECPEAMDTDAAGVRFPIGVARPIAILDATTSVVIVTVAIVQLKSPEGTEEFFERRWWARRTHFKSYLPSASIAVNCIETMPLSEHPDFK